MSGVLELAFAWVLAFVFFAALIFGMAAFVDWLSSL